MGPPTAMSGRTTNMRAERFAIARASALATLGTVAGYLASVVQQFVYARSLGVGADTDALAAALAWAVSITGLIGVTFATVVVPLYVNADRDSRKHADQLFVTSAAIALTLTCALAFFTTAAAPQFARALLPGSGPDTARELAALLGWSVPLHLSWTLVILVTALANARRRYVIATVATVVPSLVVIASLAVRAVPTSVIAGYSIGFLVQSGVVLTIARGLPLSWRPVARELRLILRRAAPIALAFALVNATGLLVRAVASQQATGDVAVFDYASRLTIALENVMLTGALAVGFTVWSEDSRPALPQRLPPITAASFGIGLGIIAAIGLFVLAPLLVNVLFRGGSFTDSDVERVAEAIRLLCVAMAARVAHTVGLRMLLARRADFVIVELGAVTLAAVASSSAVGSLIGYEGALAGYSAGWIIAALAVVIVATRAPRDRGRSLELD